MTTTSAPAPAVSERLPARTFPAAPPDHAAPLSAVDDITLDGTTVTGRKRIRADDPYLGGHYPDFPIYPGVFSIETVFQTARQALCAQQPDVAPAQLVAIDSVSFSAPLLPGDQLTARLVLTPHPTDPARTAVTARCERGDGRIAARIKLQLGRLPALSGDILAHVDPDAETISPAIDVVERPGGVPDLPVLEHHDILGVLPHRHPVLQVDRVIDLQPGRRLVATRAISGSEPCYARLGSGTPVEGFDYPVSLLVESLGQAGGLLWLLSERSAGLRPRGMLIFGSARGLQLFGSARPGDLLTHVVSLDSVNGDSALMSGSTYVAGRLVARVQTILALLRPGTALAAG